MSVVESIRLGILEISNKLELNNSETIAFLLNQVQQSICDTEFEISIKFKNENLKVEEISKFIEKVKLLTTEFLRLKNSVKSKFIVILVNDLILAN